MGKNSQYKSRHSQKKHPYLTLSSIDVHLSFEDGKIIPITMSPQEAFHVVSMPAFEGFITSMVPNYELSEMSEEEN